MTTNATDLINEIVEKQMAEAGTGCKGAGEYRRIASEHGYVHLEPIDTTSSAGDWDFIVSKDGRTWYLMTQRNMYPHHRFDIVLHNAHYDRSFEGTAQEAAAFFAAGGA